MSCENCGCEIIKKQNQELQEKLKKLEEYHEKYPYAYSEEYMKNNKELEFKLAVAERTKDKFIKEYATADSQYAAFDAGMFMGGANFTGGGNAGKGEQYSIPHERIWNECEKQATAELKTKKGNKGCDICKGKTGLPYWARNNKECPNCGAELKAEKGDGNE